MRYADVYAETGSHVATRRVLHAAELQAQVDRIQDNKDAANEAIIQAELVQDLRVSRFAGPPTLKHAVKRSNALTHDESHELLEIRAHNLAAARAVNAESVLANAEAMSGGARSGAGSMLRLPPVGGSRGGRSAKRPGSAGSSASRVGRTVRIAGSPRAALANGMVDLEALDDDVGPSVADLERWEGPGSGPLAASAPLSGRAAPYSARSVGSAASHLSVDSRLSLARTKVHWAAREDVAALVRRSFRNGKLNLAGLRLGAPPRFLFNTFTIALNPISHLSIARNGIAVLPESIRHFWCLESLNLSSNTLKALPDGLGDLTRLETLDASHNAIESLPESVKGMHCMRTLILNENFISTLPARLGALTALKTLNLDDNALTDLPPSFASLISLEHLSMCRNQILSLAICPIAYTLKDAPRAKGSDALDDATAGADATPFTPRGGDSEERAREAMLAQSSVSGVPTMDFSQLTGGSGDFAAGGTIVPATTSKMAKQLRRKALANRDESEWKIRRNGETRGVEFVNIILNKRQTEMPRELDLLGRLNCLRILKMNRNDLTNLPASIGKLVHLAELYAEDNQLVVLPDELCLCKVLRVLALNDNELHAFPEKLGSLQDLRELRAANNHIEVLPSSFGDLRYVCACSFSAEVTFDHSPSCFRAVLFSLSLALLPSHFLPIFRP